jgi:penicillin-binding protein 2
MLNYIQQGMHNVTQPGGTAGPGFVPLEGQPNTNDTFGYNVPGHPDIYTSGKTGTAEYCDEIANTKNLCIPGSWPSHGWFVGYAGASATKPPEIAVVTIVYNGGEGSIVAMPVVREVTACYFFLKDHRANGQTSPACTINKSDEPPGGGQSATQQQPPPS